jgi:uncharacterized damage-inducible protein DinB
MSSLAAKTANPVGMLYPELDAEIAATRKMLERVPFEHAEWRPHPRSMSLLQLASHVAQLPDFTTTMAATDVLAFNPEDFKTPPLKSTAELVAMFDEKVTKMRAALAALDWARLAGNWKMTMGDQVFVDGERAYLIRHMGINHIVHHRAQLGVYLRLLDVPIPGSYGPSADNI